MFSGHVKQNDYAKLANKVNDNVGEAVKATTKIVETMWKENIVDMDIVDTGNYLGSVHGEMLTEHSGVVSTSVNYAPPLEYGHATRGTTFVPGRPAATQAAEQARPIFEAKIKKAMYP